MYRYRVTGRHQARCRRLAKEVLGDNFRAKKHAHQKEKIKEPRLNFFPEKFVSSLVVLWVVTEALSSAFHHFGPKGLFVFVASLIPGNPELRFPWARNLSCCRNVSFSERRLRLSTNSSSKELPLPCRINDGGKRAN